MLKYKKKLICAVFIPMVVFLTFIGANAQTAVDYRFLEVVDYTNKPVADATVNVEGGCDRGKKQTNEKGQLEKGLPVWHGDCGTRDFTISKTGYYSFTDDFNITNSTKGPIKLELLKIPQTRAEREAIGNEQLKREFFVAAKKGDAAAVRNFLKSGLSPNLTTSDLRGVPAFQNIPIIFFAASSGDKETVNELLSAGANVRGKNEQIGAILVSYIGAGPFRRRYPPTDAERKELMNAHKTGVEILIKAGADINSFNSDGNTALMAAVESDNIEIAKLLIEKGAFVNAKNSFGRAALISSINNGAALKSRIEMADLLLKSGADINVTTNDDNSYWGCRTALMVAILYNDIEMVKFLIANKADVNKACQSGITALKTEKEKMYVPNERDHQEIIRLLEAAGAR